MNNYGFVRIATAVPNCKVADVKFNCNEIIKLITEANNQKAEAIVFPELSITAYTCGDLFYTKTLQNAAITGLAEILNATKDMSIISIIGMPISVDMRLFNCAVALQKGKILGVVPKSHIPNHSEFYERRWFCSSNEAGRDEITIEGQTVPFSPNIIFENSTLKFAIEICEDMWVSTPPSSMHTLNGANVMFNLSASNAVIGKRGNRTMLVKGRSFSSHCGYVFVSAGIGESTTDTVFSGHTIVAENGSVLFDEVHTEFESKLFYTEIDMERIESDRKKVSTFSTYLPKQKYCYVKTEETSNQIDKLTRTVNRFPFVPRISKNKNERMGEIYSLLTCALAKRLLHTNIKHPVIGISGGLDSTLALLIVVNAMDKLKIPRDNIIAITMPGFGTTDRTLENAKKLMNLLGTTSIEISIKDACIQHFKDINQDINKFDITYENSQARERTQILMDIANQRNGLVIGTGDLSELALGWATYAGDHISMYGVNSGVPKTLIRHLVTWISEENESEEIQTLLNDVLDTPISPELLPADAEGMIAQKTEEILGDYVLHDFFLYYFLRFGFEPEKILYLAKIAFDGKYDEVEIKNCLKKFFTRFFNHQFKRSCMPDGPKIGSVTLSPRTDLRMPSDASAALWIESL